MADIIKKYNIRNYVFAFMQNENKKLNIYLKTNFNDNQVSKNISYELSKEDEERQKKIQLIEEEKEKERIKRLTLSDTHAFNTYDAIHQRMIGRYFINHGFHLY